MDRVILADDHGVLRDGLRALIAQRSDLAVVGDASDGYEAVEMAEKLDADLVVMDIWMPRLSGIEATRRIALGPSRCKVLILSLHEGRTHVEAALRAGASGYLVKSSAASELLKAIDTVLDGRSYISPTIADCVVAAIGAAGAARPPTLTNREREVLELISEGLSTREIAARFGVSLSTANTHRAKIMEKLDIHKVAGLVRFAIREGLVQP